MKSFGSAALVRGVCVVCVRSALVLKIVEKRMNGFDSDALDLVVGFCQYVAAFLMMNSLRVRGYNVLAISSPSWKEFVHMVNLAAPILLTMISKV
jgi:hypothetical protein